MGQLRLKLKANRIKALLFARPDTTISKRQRRDMFKGPPGFALPRHSITPPLQHSEDLTWMSRIGHGLSRVVSRVGREKRPVFIDLSRCHGSARGDAPKCSMSNVQFPNTWKIEDCRWQAQGAVHIGASLELGFWSLMFRLANLVQTRSAGGPNPVIDRV